MTSDDDDRQLDALLAAVRALDDAAVLAALIGGLAVGIRSGVARATQDIDLAAGTRHSRRRVVEVLERAGFTHLGSHEHSENFRHRSDEPLQVAFDLTFDPMIERAEPLTVAGRTVRVVLREDLIAMKELAAQDPTRRKSKALRDLADIELLRGDIAPEDEGW